VVEKARFPNSRAWAPLNDLCDNPVEVGVGGPLNPQVPRAQLVDGLQNSTESKFLNFCGPRSRFRVINFASLCGVVGRYDQ